MTVLKFHIFPKLNQRYCKQDKKYLSFQDIRSPSHETPSLLPCNENKDATSINDFTDKNLANKRQHTLLLLLFYIIIFQICSWEHCHPLLYLLNSLFFNFLLIVTFALSPYFVMICCFLEKQMDMRFIFVSNHRSYGITINHIIGICFCPKTWTVCKENEDFIDILVWLRHPVLGFIHWDNSYLVSSIFKLNYLFLELNSKVDFWKL